MAGWMVATFLGGDTEACILFIFLFCFCFCVYRLYSYVHNVERYSSDLSENGLLNTQAVLSLHHTIPLFMNLNKKVILLL